MATDAFAQALEAALDHVRDTAWLGRHSPLASPFALAHAGDAAGRGDRLRELLLVAAGTLDAEAQLLLRLSFFERDANLNVNGVVRKLNTSRAAYYRKREAALASLGAAFCGELRPAVRLEQPMPRPLIGRTSQAAVCLEALNNGDSVSIAGVSGMGKTTLGAHLADRFIAGQKDRAVFWYTVRPPLNDQFASFAFSLAAFFHASGASTAWQQIVADAGAVVAARVLPMLRHDVARLHVRALVCVDECDLLRLDTHEHAQILQLLDDLKASLPVLMMGQQQVLETSRAILLTGLELAAAGLFLPGFDAAAVSRAHASTRGSPAMLSLLSSLCSTGEPPERALQQLETSPTLEVMVRRVWQRLDEPTRELLAALSVHRGSAPADAFSDHVPVLGALQQRDLVRPDGGGGVALPTYVREFVLAVVPAELRPVLHIRAARSYEARAQFTAAAYHYLQAREPAMAVWVWHAHRAAETAQGRAPTARTVFADVSLEQLPATRDRQALALLRAEWARAAGDGDAGLAALDAVTWPAAHPQQAHTQLLRGQLLEMRGELESAVEAFRKGLRQMAESPAQRESELRASLAYARYRQGELAQAQLSAIEAQVRAQGFRGFIEWHMGHVEDAGRELAEALALARKHPVSPGVLQSALVQAGVQLWQTGRAGEAQTVLAEALTLADQTGDTLGAQYLRLNLAAAALTAGQPRQALEHASAGLAMSETMQHAYLIAGNSINAAEAELSLGHIEPAHTHAMRALNQEEGASMPGALTVLGRIQMARGEWTDAVRSLQLADTVAGTNVDRFSQAHALHWLAKAHVMQQPPDVAAAREAEKRAQTLFQTLNLASPG